MAKPVVTLTLLAPDRLQVAMTKRATSEYKRICRLLYQHGEKIMAKSKKLVPVLTGALKDSGSVQVREQGERFTVELGYGGPAAPYAVFVHEDALAEHKVGQADYLGRPYREAQRELLNDIRGGKK
jgi:hypothetical protein